MTSEILKTSSSKVNQLDKSLYNTRARVNMNKTCNMPCSQLYLDSRQPEDEIEVKCPYKSPNELETQSAKPRQATTTETIKINVNYVIIMCCLRLSSDSSIQVPTTNTARLCTHTYTHIIATYRNVAKQAVYQAGKPTSKLTDS